MTIALMIFMTKVRVDSLEDFIPIAMLIDVLLLALLGFMVMSTVGECG